AGSAFAVAARVLAVVTLLEVGLDDAVAAPRASLAVRSAATVRAVVDDAVSVIDVAVVALLAVLVLDDLVATTRAECAGRTALAVIARVLRAVVALLTHGDHAVPAVRRALARVQVEPAQRELEGRAVDLALRVEHRDLVDLPRFEPVVTGRGVLTDGLVAERGRRAELHVSTVDRQAAAERRVPSAEVQRELAVQEHPNVVVAREIEPRGELGIVLEPVTDLGGEVEVVRAAVEYPAVPIGWRDLPRLRHVAGRQGIDRKKQGVSVISFLGENARVVASLGLAGVEAHFTGFKHAVATHITGV